MFAGICRIVAMWASVVIATAAMAQPIPPSVQPGRERERFVEPRAPLAQPGGTAIALPSTVAPEGAAKITIKVRAVEITGSTVYGSDQLAPLYADLIGQSTSLQAVYDLAQNITAKYGNDGYVLSRAIVPPQQLEPNGAVIRLKVIEGYVDRVEWPKSLDSYVNFFSDYTARIIAVRPANIRTIERYLLLAGDLPGLKFKNSLKPSADQTGAATLVVEVVEKRIDAQARVDNRGTPGQGPYEYFGSITVNNLMRRHEAFTASYAGAFETKELQYFAGLYRQVLTSEGLSVFADASYGFGRPGTTVLQAIGYQTKTAYLEAGLSYPFIRSRERNLSMTGLAFASDNRADTVFDIQAPPNSHDILHGLRAKLDGDAADPLKGINQLNTTVSQGIQGAGTTQNGNPMASRLGGRVDFTKAEATLSRLQPLPANFSVFLAAYGQYAATPLLTSEACSFGGRVFGRAFDPSQIIADHCVEELGEVRYDVALGLPAITQTQFYVYGDHGWLHNLTAVAPIPANVNAASAGGGLRLGWQDPFKNQFTADLSAAKAVEGPRNDWRFFFIMGAKF
jgi:hemolysin activation/secretion protein